MPASESQAPVDIRQITTWEQALRAFACPECSERIGQHFEDLSPGLVSVGSHAATGVCQLCQPQSVQYRFDSLRRGATDPATARRMLDQRYPVRWVWDWEGHPGNSRAVVRDRASGDSVWSGSDRDNGFDAQRVIEDLNAEWFAQLEGPPPPP